MKVTTSRHPPLANGAPRGRVDLFAGDLEGGGPVVSLCEVDQLRNRVLLTLSSRLREQLLRHCRYVEFCSGHVIYPAGAPVERVYFIDSGLVSLVKSMADGRSAEIGAIGSESLVGGFAAMGLDRPLVDYVVEVPVTALCIDLKTLQKAMSEHCDLYRVIGSAIFLRVEQIAQTAACNRLHSLEQRCCRWLLVAHDNTFSDHFALTHEFLATLLGVQRPSVSMTANDLQRRGFIHYVHGKIAILARAELERLSCECYNSFREHIEAYYGQASGD
jgi:CRP-like cAMP-binding protein